MTRERWQQMWDAGRIGFHQADVNADLRDHAGWLGGAGAGRVLVPLCGKSKDLAWLATRFEHVVGVEFVEAACRAFFEEHGIEHAARAEGGATRLEGGGLTLLAADFLETRPDLIGAVDAFYDRAAAVALPAGSREAYASHLASLVRPGARGLMVTFEYDQSAAAGPPFSVPDEEVRGTWSRHFELEHRDAGPVAGLPERFGGVAARKSVWRLIRRG